MLFLKYARKRAHTYLSNCMYVCSYKNNFQEKLFRYWRIDRKYFTCDFYNAIYMMCVCVCVCAREASVETVIIGKIEVGFALSLFPLFLSHLSIFQDSLSRSFVFLWVQAFAAVWYRLHNCSLKAKTSR